MISVRVSFFCSINKTTGNSLDYTFFLLAIQHFTFTFHSSRIYFYDYGLRRSIPCFLISYPILYVLCCYYLVLVLFCSPSGWRMRQNIYIHTHTHITFIFRCSRHIYFAFQVLAFSSLIRSVLSAAQVDPPIQLRCSCFYLFIFFVSFSPCRKG